MIKPIDVLGFAPKREAHKIPNGGWRIEVTPPLFTKLRGSTIDLTDEQYLRYKKWLQKGTLIQEVFPELTMAEREILLSGIGQEDFERLAKDDE